MPVSCYVLILLVQGMWFCFRENKERRKNCPTCKSCRIGSGSWVGWFFRLPLPMPTSTFPCASPYRHFLSLTQCPPLPRAEVNNLKMFPAMKSQMGRSAVHKPCTTTWQIPMRQDCARPTNIALKSMSQERRRHLLPPKKRTNCDLSRFSGLSSRRLHTRGDPTGR